MRTIHKTFICMVFALVTACSNPSIVRVKSDEIAAAGIRAVYVPRFEGSPQFVEESTDMFITQLEARASVKVIQGPALRVESADVVSGGNIADTSIAVEAASKAGAQAVILGKVTSHKAEMTMNGFATVRVINVASGQVMATFHRPSGKMIALSEHQLVLAAVQRVAADVAGALR